MEHAILLNPSTYSNNSVLFSNPTEDNSATSPFQTAGVNPYTYHQQVGFQPEGFTMPSTNMNYPYQTQLATNHYQSIYPNHLNGYYISNKK